MPDFGRWTSNGGDPSLNEINRTDRFIEALSLERPVYSTDHEEAELASLLAAWRDDVRQAPMTGIVNPRDAVAALDRSVARNRPRLPLALVGSVAAAVLCLGGFGAAVYGSSPGDALYGMRSMLFGEQVTRDVQVELASTELKQVQQLIDQGNWQAAQEKLQTLTTTVATVNDAEQKQQLVNQWQELSVKVETRDPNATVPPDAPPPVLPEITITPTSPADTSGTQTSSETPSTTAPSETAPPTETSPTSPEESVPPNETSDTSAPTTETAVPTVTPTTVPSTSTLPAVTPTTVPRTTAPPTSSSAAAQLPPPTAEEPGEPSVAPTSAPTGPAEPTGAPSATRPMTTTTTTIPAHVEPPQGSGHGNGAERAERAEPAEILPGGN
jgi:hypothetical protein